MLRGPRFVSAVAAVLVAGGACFGGSISGTIHYDGATPPKQALKMDADPVCAKKHATPAYSDRIVVGPGGDTLANVFVYVKSGLAADKKFPAPAQPVVIDQHGCQYTPHVLGIQVGQKLKILNSDGLLHNIHALPKVNSQFNRAMPASVTEAEYVFDKPEPMFPIKCDVHPWMGAWIAVLPHPFFAVSGEDGKFKIDNLPPGTYQIEAWHEFDKFPAQTASVTIAGNEAKTADFTFKGPPKK